MTRYPYKDWRYFREYTIANSPATDGFPVVMTVTWKRGMRSDFRDIRFVDPATLKRCYYWIETKTDGSTATVWVRLNINQARLHLLFGNGAAASESSGANTFDFFDDFPGSSLDTTTNWQGGSGYSVTGGEVVLSSSGKILSKATRAAPYVMMYRARESTKGNNINLGSNVHDSSNTNAVGAGGATGYLTSDMDNTNGAGFQLYKYTGSWASLDNPAFTSVQGTFYEIKIDVKSTGITQKVYSDNWAALLQTATTTDTTYSSGYIGLTVAGTGVSKYDWIAIRKYAATEPTFAYARAGINPWFFYGRRPGDYIVNPYAGTEYVWDPVNVDHTHTPGIGDFIKELTFEPANVNHSHTAGVGVTECEMGPVNVYHGRYPVFSWDRVITNPVDDTSGNLIGVTVSRGMDDAMTQADFDYDGTAIGSIFSNDYMTKIQVLIPDYNGTSRCIFVGIAPSSRTHYEPAKDRMVLTAVDYGLYLTKNPLEDKDLALLPPANQVAEESNYAKVLFYDFIIHQFQLGQRIVGGTSGATGTIVEIYQGASWRMTLYPATGKFIDDEPLLYGGIQYAQADGRSLDIPYTAPAGATIYPEDWVRSVLGGENWMRVTGIEPYKIVSSGGYWDTATCPAVPFMFGSKESKFDALQRLAKYMRYIMLIKNRDLGGGIYRPALYWVPLSSIDDPTNGLDLPAAVSITGPNDSFLAAPFELEQNGDNQVDVVKLMCQDLYGNWLTSSKGTNYANAGEGPIRMFYDEPQDIAMQTDLNALRDDLYDLLTPRGMVWHCTLVERSDLELYQLLTISGYGAKIPNGTYRIVKISHERACAKNLTHVTIMLSTAFSTLLKYGMTYTDSISEIQKIIKKYNDQKPQTELGTCTITDSITITYETEAGNTGRGRDGTAVGVTPGTIIVGAKIIIHSTRGGIVCLPIIGEPATNTNLSTVDEPTIISAAVDPADHNYWHLIWQAGANNTGVSVNVQIGSYPSAPGSVSGAGYTFARYTAAVTKIRIRFYGPSITYYVKIWGERNGAYSATGAQTTIVSGADVTPGDEEPEIIVVIDEMLAAGIADHTPSDYVPHEHELFNAPLPFSYNGTDNIYIGGPKAQVGVYGGTWHAGYVGTDDDLKIYGPNGMLQITGGNQWHAPLNIKNLLNAGSNTVRIVLVDTIFGYHGCSDLYIRTFFGA